MEGLFSTTMWCAFEYHFWWMRTSTIDSFFRKPDAFWLDGGASGFRLTGWGRNDNFAAPEQATVKRKSSRPQQCQRDCRNNHSGSQQPNVMQGPWRRGKPRKRDTKEAKPQQQ